MLPLATVAQTPILVETFRNPTPEGDEFFGLGHGAAWQRPRSRGSMTVPEIAAALALAPRTVDRHWAFTRAWLKRTIRSSLSGLPGPG